MENIIRKNNKMLNYLIFFILLLSRITLAEEPLKIELEKRGNYLRVYFINLSDKSILLNKWVIFGLSSGAIEYTIEIIDKNGEKIPFSYFLDRRDTIEDDMFTLLPRCIIGREFKPEELVEPHLITEPGLYKVRAIYRNRDKEFLGKGIYNGSLTSDWVSFEVTEKIMENAKGKDWRNRMQKALEQAKKSKEFQEMLEENIGKRKNEAIDVTH
jgi:hypothetical protein